MSGHKPSMLDLRAMGRKPPKRAPVRKAKGTEVQAFVVLESGEGNELDRKRIASGDDAGDDISQAIKDVIDSWTLDVGDIIRIVEV